MVRILDSRVRVLLHAFGLGSLGGAVFLEALTFFDIWRNGIFMAVEHDPFILTFEIIMTLYAITYFVYTWVQFVSVIKPQMLAKAKHHEATLLAFSPSRGLHLEHGIICPVCGSRTTKFTGSMQHPICLKCFRDPTAHQIWLDQLSAEHPDLYEIYKPVA